MPYYIVTLESVGRIDQARVRVYADNMTEAIAEAYNDAFAPTVEWFTTHGGLVSPKKCEEIT